MPKKTIDEPSQDWITVGDLAKALEVSTGTVRNWIKAGKVKADKISPRIWRIPLEEAERLTHKDKET